MLGDSNDGKDTHYRPALHSDQQLEVLTGGSGHSWAFVHNPQSLLHHWLLSFLRMPALTGTSLAAQ